MIITDKEVILFFFTSGFLIITFNFSGRDSEQGDSERSAQTYKTGEGYSFSYMLSKINLPWRFLSTIFRRNNMTRFLGQNEAINIDQELFNEYKFSVDQLMELAGLSVATVIAKQYENKKNSPVLIIAGPGNNGGDGMVAARHLKLFGFSNVTLLGARKPNKDLFINLVHQAQSCDVNISYDPSQIQNVSSLGIIVDALFGFSFKPPVRPDFQPLMEILTKGYSSTVPIVAVDIPSGWDVENGPNEKDPSLYFMPDTLISLTAPKACAKYFKGSNHYVGGRFVPSSLALKYSLNLPEYPGTECVVKL